MLYWLVKPLGMIFFRIFYKFGYKGLEKVPYGKPVVFAPNHVNAFVDPIAIGILTKQKVRFFARGDVFKKRIAQIVLNSLSVSPVFRIQEGYSEIKKNDKTFEECRRRLANNETLLMFPEAVCIQVRNLRPLKKGVSRIVFQAEETYDFNKDVIIIPVGLNYDKGNKFRSRMFVHFGDPISAKEYKERYMQDKVRTINEFTKDLEKEMSKQLVLLKNPANEKMMYCIEEMYMHEWLKGTKGDVKSVEDYYYGSRGMAEMINNVEERDPALLDSLRQNAEQYGRRLRGNGLRDHLLRPENIEKNSLGNFILDFFIIWLGMPFYGLGLLMNYPPYYIAKRFSIKNIKNIEFFASVYSNMAMLLWVIYYGIQLLTVALVFRNWYLLGAYALIAPLLGLFCVKYYPLKEKIFGRWRLLRMVRKERNIVEELITERNVILSQIEAAKRV